MIMKVLNGKGISEGIVFGKIVFYKKAEICVEKTHTDDPKAEIKRFIDARRSAIKELRRLYNKALKKVGKKNAEIFDIHQAMLQDKTYSESVENIITSEEVNAEYAVTVTSDNLEKMISAADDDYIKERATDVKDVSARVLNKLINKSYADIDMQDNVIICADDLVPSEAVQLDKSKVLALCTCNGSSTSHTAILARTMGIPSIIGLGGELSAKYDGKEAIVDGTDGKLYIEPDKKTSERMLKKQQDEDKRKKLLQSLKGKETITLDGKKINVFANIGSLAGVRTAIENDAEGIGLFRSEFLYLEDREYPTEELQFQCYKHVLEKMNGKRVIIRTLDVGADKKADYFDLKEEENPALGYRAIRICLNRPEIFKTQLRALYRASVYGDLGIIFPMITSLDEVIEIKEIIYEVKESLKNDGIAFKDDVDLGIMIETPAAAIISDLLAREVDFFSIGTNDLTQYCLAIDRQNPELDKYFNPYHSAVIRLIKMTVENAHNAGIKVGICGELGGDLTLTEDFVKMGVDELSVNPSQVLLLRERIRSIKYSK